MRRHGMFYQDPPGQRPAQAPNSINWPVVVKVGAALVGLTVIIAALKPKPAPSPPSLVECWPGLGMKALLEQNQATLAQPSKAPLLWLGLGGATLLGGWKLIDHLAARETPAPALPHSPVPTEAPLSALMARLALPPPPIVTTRTETPKPTWTPPVDARWLTLAPHPSVILILGKRGSGKSALGYRLLELFRNQAAPYVVGLPAAARKLLPDWVGCADRLEDVPPKAVVLLDESYIQYHARNSMSDEGRTIGQMVNLSRQKEQSLIFIVQEGRQLDINAISQADVIAIKELSEISREFERPQLRRFTDKARVTFVGVKGNRQRQTWVYSEAAGEVGLVENELASFWKPTLSRAFAKPAPDQTGNGAGQRKGARTPKDDLVERAKTLRQQGHSFGEIGKILGIPRSTAFDYANE